MIKLVKYDYDSLPKEWRENNNNPFDGVIFAFLGEVENMKGHGYYQDMLTGVPYILDFDSMADLTESELTLTIEI